MDWRLAPIVDFAGFLSVRYILAVGGVAGLIAAAIHLLGRAPEAKPLPAAAIFACAAVALLVLIFLTFASYTQVLRAPYRFTELALSIGAAMLLFTLCSALVQGGEEPWELSPTMLIAMLILSAAMGLAWASMLILHRAIWGWLT